MLEQLVELVRGRRIVALTGAGCSTESGIPDYRGAGAPPRRAPVQYQEFVRSATSRARYWARSSIGWTRVRDAQPNAAHVALARMEAAGHVAGVITQNVDGLHGAAGSRRVVELHGSLATVRCLDCSASVERDAFQQRIRTLNPGFGEDVRAASAPDGDADVPDALLARFVVPGCADCGGIMKPHVVFFGENVPAPVVADAWELYRAGDVLLVAGSSLAVFSGRRFVHRACDEGVPVAVVNRGPTRADDVAAVKVDGALGVVLPQLAAALSAAGVPVRP